MTSNISGNQALKSWGLLLILSLIWGSSFILIKKGLVIFSAAEVGAYRIFSAAVVLLPYSLPKLRKLNKKQVGNLILVGLVGSFIPAFLFAEAQTQLSSSITGVLNALTPLFVVLIGALFFGSKVTKQNALGLLIAFCGVFILITQRQGSSMNPFQGINAYALLVILATVCYGLNLNLIKQRFVELKSIDITAISLLMVLPASIILLVTSTNFTAKLQYMDGALEAVGYLTILGVMGTAVALVLFNGLVKIASPVFASTVTYLIPIVAISWGVIDGEVLLPGHYIGIAAVIVGVWVGNRKKKRAVPSTSTR